MACYGTHITSSEWESLKEFGIVEIDNMNPLWWVDAVNIPFQPWDGYIDLCNTPPPSDSMSKRMQETQMFEPIQEVCWFFIHGRCSYGENCKNLHSLPPSPLQPIMEEKSVICKHFQMGKCRFGDGCFKLHVLKTR